MNNRKYKAQFKPYLQLLRGNSNEEQVAGLLLTCKVFGAISSNLNAKQVEDLIRKTIAAVGPKFIFRMLATNPAVDQSDGEMKNAAISILNVVAQYPAILEKFKGYEPILLNAMLKVKFLSALQRLD